MRRLNSYKRVSQDTNFWQSYSDMMAALLLVFVLVLVGTIFQAQKNFEQKQKVLEEQAMIIEEQAEQLEKILGVRQEIIEELKKQLTNTELTINSQTGAIMFDSNLLFDYDKSVLKEYGKSFLNDFMPKYMNILLGDEFSSYVAEIIVEGHTDQEGSYVYNLQLSQNRALAVAEYCLSDSQTLFSKSELETMRKIITANGRSWSDLIYHEDGTVNAEASRRVEIQFRLKDEEMIKEMIDVIEQ